MAATAQRVPIFANLVQHRRDVTLGIWRACTSDLDKHWLGNVRSLGWAACVLAHQAACEAPHSGLSGPRNFLVHLVQGSVFSDVCVHLWCHCFAVAQEAVEADTRELGQIAPLTLRPWPEDMGRLDIPSANMAPLLQPLHEQQLYGSMDVDGS